MTNTRRVMAACAVVFALTTPAAAQQAETGNAAASAPATIMKRPAPALTLTLQEVNVAEQTVTTPLSLPAQQRRGSSVALMVVGGAALVLGAIIGGDAGTIMMVGGAGVGLWGLYHYMR